MTREKRRARSARRRALRCQRRARRRSRPCRRSTLAALTASALALPGLAAGDSPVSDISADYSFSWYSEDKLPASKVTDGSERDRYTVKMQQFALESPLFERVDVGVDVVHETMSGATPWYVVPDEDGDPIQVMTGATVEDSRTDVLATGRYYFDDARASLSGGASIENDYLAFNGSVGGEHQFNDNNTTVSGGISFSYDQIEPTDADQFPLRPSHETRNASSVFAGISRVLTEGSVVQTSLNYRHDDGYLSDPYKQVLVEGAPIADSRPDTRNRVATLTRYRHHFEALDGSLHADYRFYLDDWEMNSHTLELAWYQSLWGSLQLVPSFRYYSQSQAEFYGPYFEQMRADGHYSSDYRLSPYGAISFGLKAETSFDVWRSRWRAVLAYERYVSGGDLALGKVSVENPGLVSYHLFSLGLTARF